MKTLQDILEEQDSITCVLVEELHGHLVGRGFDEKRLLALFEHLLGTPERTTQNSLMKADRRAVSEAAAFFDEPFTTDQVNALLGNRFPSHGLGIRLGKMGYKRVVQDGASTWLPKEGTP